MILIFDLDNTLYNRAHFVNNGLDNVASLISSKSKKYNKEKIFNILKKTYNNNLISNTFNFFLRKNSIKNISIKKCIKAYRFGKNNIRLYSCAFNILNHFKSKCYLITDGNKLVQKYKIKILKIDKYFKKIFITNSYGIKYQKPSLHCFNIIKKIENCKYNEMIYVGDNPNKDFINCNKSGILTIRLMRGEFKSLVRPYPYDAKYKIKNLKEIKKVIKKLSL